MAGDTCRLAIAISELDQKTEREGKPQVGFWSLLLLLVVVVFVALRGGGRGVKMQANSVREAGVA